MATFIQSLMLDVAGRNRYKYVYAKQGDRGSRFVNVTMLANGVKIVPESGTTAKIRALKPDGTGVFNPATINANGTITAALTSQMLAVKGDVQADIMLVGSNNEILSTVTFYIKVEEAPAGEAIESSNEFLELAKTAHTHDNKDTLDKFGELEDGNPTFNGKALGDGSEKEIFKIPVTITEVEEPADGELFKVEHTVTLAEIEAATKEGKMPVVLADLGGATYTLRPIYYYPGAYVFSLMVDTSVISMVVMLSGDEEVWQFVMGYLAIRAEDIYYVNRYYNSINSVQEALDKLIPEQVTSGTSITLADNTEYRLTDVTELTITYPDGNFECWMRLTFAADGAITVTLPSYTKYIGTTPTFANGETWEMSIKDGIVIAGKVA